MPLARTLTLSVALVAASLVVLPGCGEDGVSANCPPLSLYDIGAAGERSSDSVVAERNAAVAAGCMSPLGEPTPDASGTPEAPESP
jgi:hypothetical protein